MLAKWYLTVLIEIPSFTAISLVTRPELASAITLDSCLDRGDILSASRVTSPESGLTFLVPRIARPDAVGLGRCEPAWALTPLLSPNISSLLPTYLDGAPLIKA